MSYLGGGGPGGLGPQGSDSKNLVLAMVLCVAILFGFEYFWAAPQREALQAQQKAKAQAEQQLKQAAGADAAGGATAAPAKAIPATEAIAQSARVTFDNPQIDGTINLAGARFDDLSLKAHRQTVKKDSPEVRLLSPDSAEYHLDAVFGWEGVVGASSVWTAPAGAKLTPGNPITLTHDTGDGLTIERTISVDDKFVFTIADKITNAGASPRELTPFATVRRTGLPDDFIPNQIVHQGLMGVFGGEKLIKREARYEDAEKHAKEKLRGKKLADERILAEPSVGGWMGISDHYWLTAILPDQKEKMAVFFDARPEGTQTNFRASYTGEKRSLAKGQTLTHTQRFYAGAKTVDLLQSYEKSLSLPMFDKAVDWGFLEFLTRPLFWLLDHFGAWFGNFGLAIMATTVVVKILLFPLVNQSFEAMSKMKKIQPKMQDIQKRFENDKPRQQQEMLKLYQTEKINPVAGCVPILLQIPIFYALYKVLTVTIEMRHAPFFGWIQDLSAKDPTSWVNLFGILPFDISALTSLPVVGAIFAVGVFPILYGVTMWGVQSLSPPPPDPIQKQVFAILPWMFVFLFAGFASGLVIYWVWSNILTIAQQYVIMRKNGVETELDKLIAKWRGKPATDSGVAK